MNRKSSPWAWLAFFVGAAYFLLPLIATFEFSLRMERGVYSFKAYQVVFGDPRFQETFLYSVTVAIFTILLGVLLVVPTAYWIRLRLPQLRPFVEFVTLLPLVIPAIVIVFGYIRMYGSNSPRATSRLKSSTTVTDPKVLEMFLMERNVSDMGTFRLFSASWASAGRTAPAPG